MNRHVPRAALAALSLAWAATAHAASAVHSVPPQASTATTEELVLNPADLRPAPPAAKVKALKAAAQARRAAAGPVAAQAESLTAATTPLKIWQYSYVSPRDGKTYAGSIVGSDPRLNGARATSIPVVIIPLRIEFTGTVRTFDPTKPDVGCLGGVVSNALDQTTQSPMFTPVPNYTFNGVNMGNVTFIDGFQRAQFWQDANGGPMVNAKPAFHTNLPYTVAPVQTLTMANNTAGIGASYAFNGTCGSNPVSADNPATRYAFIDINYLDVQLNNIIASLGIPPSTFALFLTYRTYMTDGPPGSLSGNCCILGYHSSDFGNPANPGHTYGIAGLENGLFANAPNVSTLSHELLEWMNDPSGNNLVPPWGNIGQVSGCQNNLETGDPMSGTLHSGVVMPNGITYYAQENAFFSWFLGTGFQGAGGKYSSNGTFGGFAKNCPSGGTN